MPMSCNSAHISRLLSGNNRSSEKHSLLGENRKQHATVALRPLCVEPGMLPAATSNSAVSAATSLLQGLDKGGITLVKSPRAMSHAHSNVQGRCHLCIPSVPCAKPFYSPWVQKRGMRSLEGKVVP